MSTVKSLKKNLMANVSNYFEKQSGRDSSSYIQQTFQATGISRRTVSKYEKNYKKPVHFRRATFEMGTIQSCGRI